MRRLPKRLIVGLGNPGKEYKNTRHNIGFEVLERFQEAYVPRMVENVDDARAWSSELNAGRTARAIVSFNAFRSTSLDLVDLRSDRRRKLTEDEGVPYPSTELGLLLPDTFMNRSGSAVLQAIQREKLKLKRNMQSLNQMDELIVVTDDVNIPFGECRMKPRGGHGGHNGLRDISSRIATDRYIRMRVGVGDNKSVALGAHVLGKFQPHEKEQMPDLTDFVCELLRVHVHRGFDAAANISNSWSLSDFLALKRK
eukprot:g2984.t1